MSKLWTNAGLPNLTPIDEVIFSKDSVMESIYDEDGFKPPKILKGFPNASFYLLERWTPSYLYDQFSRYNDFRVMLTNKTFLRGTDYKYEHPDIEVFKGEEAANWMFARKDEWESKKKLSAFIGLSQLGQYPEMMEDLEFSLPGFMKVDPPHNLPYKVPKEGVAFWAQRGHAVDSGLHYDTHKGGFLFLLTGQKQVLMFPPSDREFLYLRNDSPRNDGPEHRMESSIFIANTLLENDQDKYKNLSKTRPFFALLEAGDTIYIPSNWFHEVFTRGDGQGISAWIP